MDIYNSLQECGDSPKSLASRGRPSLKDNLELQKTELEARLQRVNEALEALNANPQVLKVLELVSRV